MKFANMCFDFNVGLSISITWKSQLACAWRNRPRALASLQTNKRGLLGKASTKLSLVTETLSYLTKVLKKCPSRVEQLDFNGIQNFNCSQSFVV